MKFRKINFNRAQQLLDDANLALVPFEEYSQKMFGVSLDILRSVVYGDVFGTRVTCKNCNDLAMISQGSFGRCLNCGHRKDPIWDSKNCCWKDEE